LFAWAFSLARAIVAAVTMSAVQRDVKRLCAIPADWPLVGIGEGLRIRHPPMVGAHAGDHVTGHRGQI
jgi:hypothetical protein